MISIRLTLRRRPVPCVETCGAVTEAELAAIREVLPALAYVAGKLLG